MAEVRSADGEQATTVASRTTIRVLLVAMVAVLLVPVGQVEVWATPVTLSETVEGVEVDPDLDARDLPSQALVAAQAEAGAAPVTPAAAAAPQALSDVPPDIPPETAPDTTSDTTPDADPDAPSWLRSEVHEAPLAFNTVGISAPLEVSAITIRTSTDGEDWSDWEPMSFLDVYDGPDPDAVETTADQGVRNHTEPLWVEEARYLQFEVVGADPAALELTLIDSTHLNDGPVDRRVATGDPADASGLDIVSRAEWGADESVTRTSRVTSEVYMGVVHHTAHTTSSTANTYSPEQARGLMRAMHRYHTVNLGWADLGYNVVVDRFGTVYEGRRGGFSNGVIGAHAAGFNVHSFGVSVIGNFLDADPSEAAIQSLTEVIGVKSAIHGIDPGGLTDRVGDGRTRPTIVGHRDVGQTSCPGRIQDRLPEIRVEARETAVRFPDVPWSSPHRTAILELANDGVTSGCSAIDFCPRDSLTRAQASTFVTSALELEPIPGSRFTDVPIDGIHAGAINALAQREWLIGYPGGAFQPWDELTRGQLATVLAKSLELPLTVPATDPYPDVSRWATHAPGIAALREVGIRGDCGGGRFCADDIVLRDSTASFVTMVRKYRADVEVQVSVGHRTLLDGAPADTPAWPTPRYEVRLLAGDGQLVASALSLAPDSAVRFSRDDGLRHGMSYTLEVVEVPGTVATSVDGCSLSEVAVTYASGPSIRADADLPASAIVDATADYTCPVSATPTEPTPEDPTPEDPTQEDPLTVPTEPSS